VGAREAFNAVGTGEVAAGNEGAPEPSVGVVAAAVGVKVKEAPTAGDNIGSYVGSGEEAGEVVPAPSDDGAGSDEGEAVPDPAPSTPSSPQPSAIWVRSARRVSREKRRRDDILRDGVSDG
jgi:hypothetical protein